MTAKTPSKPGFYWAKWRIADEGTADGGECCCGAHALWEVVDVFQNGGADPAQFLRVHVPGVERSQSIENFFWGAGPLMAPIEERQP